MKLDCVRLGYDLVFLPMDKQRRAPHPLNQFQVLKTLSHYHRGKCTQECLHGLFQRSVWREKYEWRNRRVFYSQCTSRTRAHWSPYKDDIFLTVFLHMDQILHDNMSVGHYSVSIGLLCSIDAKSRILNGQNTALESHTHLYYQFIRNTDILSVSMKVYDNLCRLSRLFLCHLLIKATSLTVNLKFGNWRLP